ncbi:40S ribosomal protein S21-2 [Hibiscus syriacus]|uniref:40S ribosomal protein S21-2 n=1 Tax=Hibiscus syriacus TaxID=106335 RepID=A0A6A2ZK03_HIBSY|nr:heavy metal-associated isoprenylated plant protein 36-like [Hibiscus syriacus]KAE8691265.1 40S ribosomal protein S21-2 [Hibiscus syriacus]
MVTIEGKQETKQESRPAEPKPESNSKEVEEIQEPALKYKAWVLKVSIHCEGCKRKVEKILRKINGVYEVETDLKQQKATVKANLHVNVDTLIKKLVKKGRHAELWPEQKAKKGKSKNKDKQANTEEIGDDKDQKETVKVEVLSVLQDGASKGCENDDKDKQVPLTGNQSAVPERKGGGGGESEGNSGGGGKKKKKGRKGNASVNFEEADHPADAGGTASTGPQVTCFGPHGSIPMTSPNRSPPRQHLNLDENLTCYPAPPLYFTGYNTTYSSGYGASYYTSPSPHSYMYMHLRNTSEHPSSDMCLSYISQPSYTFELFSDENPNACSIM